MAENNSGETVWKNISMFLAGALLAGGGSVIALARDSITRTEVNQIMHEAHQQEQEEISHVNAHLEHIDQNQVEQGKELVKIGEHLGVKKSTPN